MEELDKDEDDDKESYEDDEGGDHGAIPILMDQANDIQAPQDEPMDDVAVGDEVKHIIDGKAMIGEERYQR